MDHHKSTKSLVSASNLYLNIDQKGNCDSDRGIDKDAALTNKHGFNFRKDLKRVHKHLHDSERRRSHPQQNVQKQKLNECKNDMKVYGIKHHELKCAMMPSGNENSFAPSTHRNIPTKTIL